MESLTFVGTFLATGFGLIALWQQLQGRRRAQEILRGRDPAGQRATVVRELSLTERWELAARQAGLEWTARTYLFIICAGAGAGGLFLLAGLLPVALAIVGLACFGPWLLVRIQQRSRSEQFSRQLPGALILAANTIRAGGTMLQAVRAIARQMPNPIADEFARVERALQLQVPLGTALEQARQRIGAPEFSAVVVASKVAGQAGADLDTVLENIANDIVEDRQFRDAMRAASSEGRTSARVVTAVPFLVGGYFYLTDPYYFEPMLRSPIGKLLLPLSFLSIFVGWALIRRITDVRTW
jgi:tight adherence protein B